MSDTPKLLVYHQLANGSPINPPLWVAITDGCEDTGGEGVVLAAPDTPVTRTQDLHQFIPGQPFSFGSNQACGGRVVRKTWGLDAVDDTIAAAYLKQLHLGRINQ